MTLDAMLRTFHFQQYAMATLFEGLLVGEDIGHLRAVSQCLQAEIIRIEHLLSRHDPRAELARVNRKASQQRVKVERELFSFLNNCLYWYKKTEGFFDIGTLTSLPSKKPYGNLSQCLSLYPHTQQVAFHLDGFTLDAGGCGKGYALDRLALMLKEYGVDRYLIHGGRSSYYAQGTDVADNPWEIRLPIPFLPPKRPEIFPLAHAFSYSAAFYPNESASDIIDPHTGNTVREESSCAVWASTAMEAEVWSTALLAMKSSKGREFATQKAVDIKLAFFEPYMYES